MVAGLCGLTGLLVTSLVEIVLELDTGSVLRLDLEMGVESVRAADNKRRHALL